jgi:hypothetical protein
VATAINKLTASIAQEFKFAAIPPINTTTIKIIGIIYIY